MAARWGFNYSANVILSTVSHKKLQQNWRFINVVEYIL